MNKKDFAIGVIANNPGTAGTSLVFQAGYGQTMPPVPFFLTLTPPGQMTTLGNSEKVKVTARPGNAETFTIERAQSPTTAKDIASGWIAANSIYVDDIETISFVTNEVPGGLVNGSNTAFTVASQYSPGSLRVFKNGIRLKGGGNDYTEVSGGFTLTSAPATGALLLVDYNVNRSGAYSVGSNSFIVGETPAGLVDGANTVFTTARAYIASSLVVYINGLRQAKGTHVTESSPTTGVFTLDEAPSTGDIIRVDYQYNLNPSNNADTVDGIHANTSPTAGNLMPLDSNAKIPLAVNTSRVRRELGLAFRDNTQKTVSAVGDTWYNIRNSADTADLSVTFTTTQPKFYVDFSLVIWSGSNRYKHVRLLLDGSTTGVAPAEWSASYLLNGVAPGAGLFEVTAAPGSHTITFQAKLLGAGNEALEYRGGFIRAYEVIA